MPQVGETRTNPNNPAEMATWNGQSWEIRSNAGGKPRPDIGPNARELEDGSIVSTGRNGGLQIIRGATTARTPTLGADSAPRIYAGLDAAIEGNNNIAAGEADSRNRDGGWGGRFGFRGSGNPLTDDRLASYVDGMDAGRPTPGLATDVAKALGGETYQNYNQASAAFEAAALPILSGASVTPQEAQRMIRAALPERGDSQEVLARKGRQRQQMLNGLAVLAGKPPPYPNVPSMFFGPQGGQPGAPPSTPSARPAAPAPQQPAGRITVSRRGGSASGATPPTPPASLLTEGVNRRIRAPNGQEQVWTLRAGKPVRLR